MFKTILVPIDLAEPASSTRALKAAIGMARDHGATLHAVSVVPDVGMSIVGSYFPKDFETRAIEETKSNLRAFLQEVAPDDVPVKGHVAHGGIYQEILHIAGTLSADLIVMASHRPAMRDYLLGPNAARVVRHASQSVLVVRDPG